MKKQNNDNLFICLSLLMAIFFCVTAINSEKHDLGPQSTFQDWNAAKESEKNSWVATSNEMASKIGAPISQQKIIFCLNEFYHLPVEPKNQLIRLGEATNLCISNFSQN